MFRSVVITTYILTACAFVLYSFADATHGSNFGVWLHAQGREGSHHARWRTPAGRLELWVEGDVTFTADDTGIERLGPRGWLTLERRRGPSVHTLEATQGPDGGVRYTYTVNGQARPYDAAARVELSDAWLRVIRESGVGADMRVARILRRDGIDGVFREIDEIKRSSTARVYLTELIEQGNLQVADLSRFARVVPQRVSSSSGRARLLIRVLPYYAELLADRTIRDSYFQAVDSISSSSSHARVLLATVETNALDTASLARLFASVERNSSSSNQALVLAATTAVYTNDARVREAFFDAVDSMSSSSARTRVLVAAVDTETLDAASLAAAVTSASRLSSSSGKVRVLGTVTAHYQNEPALRDAFFESVDSISSSSGRTTVLLALLATRAADRNTLLGLFESTRGISSSSGQTRVLVAAASHLDGDDDLIAAFRETARAISSAGGRHLALEALPPA